MEFKHLQAFAAVVRFGSFTKAADYLYLSQPTVSAQIRQLEEELQTQLLLRTTKFIQITPVGQELYEYASGILSMRDKIYQRCSSVQRRIVHIGASTIPSAYLLPELLAGYRMQRNDVGYELHQSDSQNIINGLLGGLYDLGIIGMECRDKELQSVRVCSDEMVLITPNIQKYRTLQQSDPNPIRTLLHDPMLLREQGSGSLNGARRFLQLAGIEESELTVAARADDSEAIKRMVINGVGVAIISDLAVKDEVESGRLLEFYPVDYSCRRSFYLVARRDYPMPDYVQELADYLCAALPRREKRL